MSVTKACDGGTLTASPLGKTDLSRRSPLGKTDLSRRSPLGEGGPVRRSPSGEGGSLSGIFRRLLKKGLPTFLAAKIVGGAVILDPGSFLGHFDTDTGQIIAIAANLARRRRPGGRGRRLFVQGGAAKGQRQGRHTNQTEQGFHRTRDKALDLQVWQQCLVKR